ncbi:MAG: ATP-binding protein [DPANN group archaeon]|nr:ATP-binding protein [DPANN group archaeon]
MVGQIIGGEFSALIVRKKAEADIELGELLICEQEDRKILLTVFDLQFGSQISQQNLELIAGMRLEQQADIDIMDRNLRNYDLVLVKPLIEIKGKKASISKSLPPFFSSVRTIEKDDLSFLERPKNPLAIGKLRSGSKVLDVDIYLEGDKVFAHHILIPATTGKGKSNLTSSMLWSVLDSDYAGILILDPHDEYYGRHGPGLKDHPSKKAVYYTPNNPPPGEKTLKINVRSLRPGHFNGVMSLSDPQRQALANYHRQYGKEWVSAILLEKPLEHVRFFEETLQVIKRKVMALLDADITNDEATFKGIFSSTAGETTIAEICDGLEGAKTVIIDTSTCAGALELLIGSMVASEIFQRYKRHKLTGRLSMKPVVSVVLEEAPRVLGKDVLEKGSNIYSTIAREGRKFKIGLTAITQLPSLIPRQILANMNTKLILGLEMAPERQAIIESASQDLTTENKAIASLDTGECIVSSNFGKFAIPVSIPFFRDIAQAARAKRREQTMAKDFSGVDLT